MKFFHLSDLHFGKTLHEHNLQEDQQYVLNQVLRAMDEEKPEAVFIAGDVYNTGMAGGDSVQLLNRFLTDIANKCIKIFMISGNHDSAEHLSFGADLFSAVGCYLSKPFTEKGEVIQVTYMDDYGPVHIYLLPYLSKSRITHVYCPKEPVPANMDEAMQLVIRHLHLNTEERNILVAHQFVTGAERGGSESQTTTVGGLDGINPATFKDFDYVALGHIHKPQNVVKDKIRYCGTLLQYSFNEEKNKNFITVVNMDKKGQCTIKTIPVEPLHKLVTVKGSFEQFMKPYVEQPDRAPVEDYLHIILTDEDDVVDGKARLGLYYHNILQLSYEKKERELTTAGAAVLGDKTPLEHFVDFYMKQNGHGPSEYQLQLVKKFLEGGDKA